ncbi:hypothetical protein BDN70DRAFT_841358 [Pholiota conissans]|uniref:RRM domain-containing protein n=1 Tax=Pholiota conissans TaxID=109636 RepID=A0A9P6CPV7_9AGAR|nr:hypothetical protein BDN70DRAFT_841358 [Pholiota conissans]
MNGYTVAGTPLFVSTLTNSPRCSKNSVDDRRNLYVLGLPFALSKNEFAALFTQYGTVSHCVILATVDNSSRRRGFVVMSSHEEAKRAMTALTRTQVKGHAIDVSWAVVQRSQGFLDGGDRAMLLDSRSNVPSPSPSPFERQRSITSDSSDSSLESHEADPASLTTSFVPTTSLLVTNLPTLLFSQAQDLHPLFFPFGRIEKLEIVQVSPLGTMSVLVQYSRVNVAQEAKESLTGQLYGSCQIEARFVRPATTSVLSDLNKNLPDGDAMAVDQNLTCFSNPILRSINREWPTSFPSAVNPSASINNFGMPNLDTASYDFTSANTRQQSISTTRPFSSNTFGAQQGFDKNCDGPSWTLDYGHMSDCQNHNPLTNALQYGVYQSSAA